MDIYEAILTKDLTAGQRAQLKEVLADAKVVLERARGDQSAIDREISKKLCTHDLDFACHPTNVLQDNYDDEPDAQRPDSGNARPPPS